MSFTETQLLSTRKNIKSTLRRIENYAKSFELEKTDIEQIYARSEQVEDIWKKYEEVQSALETLDEEQHANDREDFEERYFNTKAAVNRLIHEGARNQQLNGDTNTSSREIRETSDTSSDHHTHRESKINLPKINLPQFSGDYKEWRTFYDLFKAVVHENTSISPIEKLYYLKSTLKGEALKIITSIPSTSNNYESAFQLLEERYNNNQLIINSHLQNLFSLPPVSKYSSSSLRSLITDAKQQIESLRAFKLPVEHWDVIITYMLTQKLDIVSRREWEMNKQKGELPKLNEFFEFLETRSLSLATLESSNQSVSHSHRVRPTQVLTAATTTPYQCHLCHENHRLYKCHKFHALDVPSRIEAIKKANVCFNCLSPGHAVKTCRGTNCKKCGKNHSTFIHLEHSSAPAASTKEETNIGSVALVNSTHEKQVLLSTAIIRVKATNGTWIECRALLDSASQSNFVTETFVNKLNKPRVPCSSQIRGIAGTTNKVTHVVQLHLSSRVSNYQRVGEFLILEKIACNLPNSYIHTHAWNIPQNLQLADPHFNEPQEIDLLIGADIYLKLLKYGQRHLGANLPVMQNTTLGWIIAGGIGNDNFIHRNTIEYNDTFCSLSTLSTDELLMKFWEIESVPKITLKTTEEIECEEHFQQTIKRNEFGRYVAQLPIKNEIIRSLGNSYEQAKRRLEFLWKRFASNPMLKEQYIHFMEEYLSLNHMEEARSTENSEFNNYFIPHHAVLKESSTSTKLRVVFDASMKTDSGVSLNDALKVGPTVQSDLLSIVMRFRLYEYVFTTDIQKMYRQIQIDESHRNLQSILWSEHPVSKPTIYRLNTVTYGTASAPFIATRCLNQLANDEGVAYPLAKSALVNNCYVDDVMAGSNSLNETLRLQEELITLLSKGGFTLHKWCANNNELLKRIPSEKRETELPLVVGKGAVKLLGLLWLPAEDEFQFMINLNKYTPQTTITKRVILSDIARIFDPLGLLAPVIVKAKVMMQELWKQHTHWDEEVSSNMRNKWQEYRDQLHELTIFKINRKITLRAQIPSYEIHGFADASNTAYGACIYLKMTNESNETFINLITAKSRVAPIKPLTTPRLELCATVILARLVERVSTAIKLEDVPIHLWTDSMITLCWIQSEASRYKPFVGNRVAEVQELTNGCKWHHVPTTDNPADLLSRGVSPVQLRSSSLWWNGPTWLKYSETEWPSIHNPLEISTNVDTEVRTQTHLTFACVTKFELFKKYSSLTKLKRVVAFCQRFIHNTQKPKEKLNGNLSINELESAMTKLLKLAQHEAFREEIQTLNQNQPVLKGILKTLTPFLDEDGLLRVGGRLKNSNRSFEQNHQIILPRNHEITHLVLLEEHQRMLHAGAQAVLCSIRQQYWPIQGKRTIKWLIHHCVICFRFRAKPCTQLMANLPSYRTQLVRPFYNTGVDYGGPILLKTSNRRNAPMSKAYIALFICLATRAIHLELVSSLSTQSFISAFKRFISRRGKCRSIHSDNATNFKGAQNEMHDLRQFLTTEINKTQIIDEASLVGIEWKFIPPNAPHFGGMWEAGINTVKYHLKRAVGNLHLMFEEYYTILTQIEACVNSRPLTPLSDDPTDYSALTPAHFLIGHQLTAMPEPDLTSLQDTRLDKWQRMQKQVQIFWKRWSQEYLNTLQQRTKWTRSEPNISINDMVLIREDNMPPLSWPIARVTETHPGPDGRVRVVTVRTSSSTFKRPITKLSRLPIQSTKDEKF